MEGALTAGVEAGVSVVPVQFFAAAMPSPPRTNAKALTRESMSDRLPGRFC